ncbi:hypothetical protein EK904_010891 [Melospiza melodia maxima]|nr:hypothetical protein EK904_010891 [Melospiza melodia maxima]
MAKGNISP